MNILFYSLFFQWQLISVYSTYICTTAYQCIGSSISISNFIYCYGYMSCGSAKQLLTTGTTDDIVCYGSYSCYGSDLIETTLSNSEIYCYGLFSCSNILYLYSESSDIYCRGELSCHNTEIYNNCSSCETYCDGSESCSNSIITIRNELYARGQLSLQNSRISAYGTVYIYFYGYYSGYDASINCNSGYICNIYCYDNGCHNTILNCDINATCNINCINSEKNELCPNGTYFDFNNLITNIIINTTTFDNSFTLCDNDATNCGDFEECIYDDLYADYQNSLCCTGKSSCERTTITASNSNPNQNYLTTIRCDGHDSCSYADIIILDNNNNVSIYCSSYLSCEYSSIIGSTTKSDVYCNGQQSCYKSKIVNGNNIFCVGYLSCEESIVLSINNIYCIGYGSCNDMDVSQSISNSTLNIYILIDQSSEFILSCILTNICNIFCGSPNACRNLILYCYGECNVVCNENNNIQCPIGDYLQISTNISNTVINPINTSSSNTQDSTDKENIVNNEFLFIIIIIMFVIIILLIGLLCFFKFSNYFKNQIPSEAEMVQIQGNVNQHNKNNINNDNKSKNGEDLQNESVNIIVSNNNNHNNAHTNNLNDVPDINDINDVNNINNMDNTNNSNTDDDTGSELFGEMDTNNNEKCMTKDGIISDDLNKSIITNLTRKESNWKEWTNKDVITWITQNLINNGFEKYDIKNFVKEFESNKINGNVLNKMKQNEQLISKFQIKFENMPFGFWSVFESALCDLVLDSTEAFAD